MLDLFFLEREMEGSMPRTPKPTDGATGPAKPRRPSTKKPNGNGDSGHISSDEVAKKAYELYQSRGAYHGADFDDWIQAEKQLKETQQHAPPPAGRKRPRASAGT
jgi:hypothetical protein